MPDPVYRAIRKAEADYEFLGELGRDAYGNPAFLARSRSTGELVAIRVETTPGPQGESEVSLVVAHQLDSSVPSPRSSCPSCGAAIEGWSRYCGVCGEDVSGYAYGQTAGRRREDLLAAVRRAAEGKFEILGEMDRAEGGGIVYFARELGSGRLVTLRLQRDTSQSEVPAYMIGVTQVMRVLPWMAGGAGAAGARTDPGSGPRPASPVAVEGGRGTSDTGPQAAVGGGGGGPGGAGAAETESPAVGFCPTCGAAYADGTRFCPRDGTAVRPKAARDDLIGQVLAGRYLVKSKLGEGGMGRVYLAEHVRMGRPCAIKVMHPSLSQEADAVSRFGREAANASRIIHPNVAAIYDFGETSDGLIFLAMEYAEGEPLSRILKRDGPLSVARAAALARQVASALSAAHELSIVHRDLKPDNIMVSRARDGREIAKVIDFGIAKTVHGSTQHLTRTGFVIGTPAYMSPEQLAGQGIDGRSDIYSLGCILYEMLAGQPAFAGPSGEVSITRRLTEPPPRIRAVNPKVPRALDGIIARAMALAPEDRFQTAAELEVALAGPFREEEVGGLRGRIRALATGSAWRAITGQRRKPGATTGGRSTAGTGGASGETRAPEATTVPTAEPAPGAVGPEAGGEGASGGVRIATPPARPIGAGEGVLASPVSGERPVATGGPVVAEGGEGAAVSGLEPVVSRTPTPSELIPAAAGAGAVDAGPVLVGEEVAGAGTGAAGRRGRRGWGWVGAVLVLVLVLVRVLANQESDPPGSAGAGVAAVGQPADRGAVPATPEGEAAPAEPVEAAAPADPEPRIADAVQGGPADRRAVEAGREPVAVVGDTSPQGPGQRPERREPEATPAARPPASPLPSPATAASRPQEQTRRADPPEPPGPTEEELRPVRAALARGQVATQRGEFRVAREQLTIAEELIAALSRLYPNSTEILELEEQVARAVERNACETLRAVRIQRGENPPQCP